MLTVCLIKRARRRDAEAEEADERSGAEQRDMYRSGEEAETSFIVGSPVPLSPPLRKQDSILLPAVLRRIH